MNHASSVRIRKDSGPRRGTDSCLEQRLAVFLYSMALLELLSASTGTWVISPDLVVVRAAVLLHRRPGVPFLRRRGELHVLGADHGWRVLRLHPHLLDGVDDLLRRERDELLVHAEGLALVFDERVPLAVAAQPDPRAQVVHDVQVIDPE